MKLSPEIEALLKPLTPEERRILILRFGLDGGSPRTHHEVGEVTASAADTVRSIELRAMQRLQTDTQLPFRTTRWHDDKVDSARSRQAWTAASVVFAALGALAVLGALWNVFVEGSWWSLVGLPVAVIFCYWLGVGAWRRGRRP